MNLSSIVRWISCVVTLVALTGYFYHRHLESELRMEIEEAASRAQIGELRQLVKVHGAIHDWLERLMGGEAVRLAPVMSTELQQVWLAGRPILFLGTLRDIAANPDGSFKVLLRHDPFAASGLLGAAEFLISTVCSPEQSKSLLSIASNKSRLGLFAELAAVLKVNAISSKGMRTAEGGEMTQFTGEAECLEVREIRHSISDSLASQLGEK